MVQYLVSFLVTSAITAGIVAWLVRTHRLDPSRSRDRGGIALFVGLVAVAFIIGVGIAVYPQRLIYLLGLSAIASGLIRSVLPRALGGQDAPSVTVVRTSGAIALFAVTAVLLLGSD